MQEITASVLVVEGRNTSKGTVYDVSLSDGVKYTAWEPELAAQANALLGQVVQARIETSTNNKNGRTYTNHTLREIGLPGTLAPLAQPAVPGTAVPVAQPAVPVAQPAANGAVNTAPIPMPIPDEERQKLIVRQSVLATAFRFVGTLYNGAGPEALEAATTEAMALAATLFGKVYAKPAAPSVPVTTPAAVAEQVNAQAETGVAVGVGPQPEWD